MRLKNILNSNSFGYDIWNKWSDKSKNVAYERSRDFGAGEKKLAEEFGTTPLGQNSSYDLYVNGVKYEVKEQDTDGSFRLGVESLGEYNKIIIKLLNIFNSVEKLKSVLSDSRLKEELVKIYESIFEKKWGNSRTLIYDGFKKSEVSESNLNVAEKQINALIELMSYEFLKKIELFSPVSALKKDFLIENAYDLLILDGQESDYIKQKLGNDFNLAVIRSSLRELKFFKEDSLKSKLNKVVRDVFLDKKLVLVNKKMGYKIINNYENLVCYRITQGGPRCKYPL